MNKYFQKNFFLRGISESTSDKNEMSISFRDAYDFPRTNYGLFGLYKYPAKFIPYVVLYIISKYSKEGDIIFDPFAGQGTVGYASWLFGRDYILWDLNPLLDFLHKFVDVSPINYVEIYRVIKDLFKGKEVYYPDWKNLTYWYPEEILELLGKAWYKIKNIDSNDMRCILTLSFLKISKFFSYADEKVHKLYKSRRAVEKINSMLRSDLKEIMIKKINEEILRINERLNEWKKLKLKRPTFIEVKAGIDTSVENLKQDIDILISSPPYLQAQEYIRSTKMELYWLGYTDREIRELSSKEIPYRSTTEDFPIYSDTYFHYLGKIKDHKLLKLYKTYFNYIIGSLERLSLNVKKYMCIFVGPVKVEGMPIPIDKIIKEHFISIGWNHVITYVDKVKSRVMFRTKTGINPASGRVETRMETEHLVVLKRD